MSRRTATALHLALVVLGLILYVVFVLPRWWVLTGDIPATLATAGRIAAGFPIALAALPVLAVLRQALTRKVRPPEIALRLRAWSAVLHVAAGALILLPAIVEIWLRLEAGGPYLFAVYGAAAAVAALAVLAWYLSHVAEKPPTAPKEPKPAKVRKAKAEKKPRGKKRSAAESAAEASASVETLVVDTDTTDDAGTDDAETTEVATEQTSEKTSEETVEETTDETSQDATAEAATGESPGGLRNKRPAGKSRRRLGR